MTRPRPFAEFGADEARQIRAVLFDIDDTITEGGLLLEESYRAIWLLRRSGIAAVPVTGRPAGWCDLIARQWPVAGVVGENGAFAYHVEGGRLERIFHPSAPDPADVRARLAVLGERALAAFPGLRIAKDQPYRLFDLALDFAEEPPDLGIGLASRARDFCAAAGASAKISSIHVNAWFGDYDKLSMAELFLSTKLGLAIGDAEPGGLSTAVLYFGDSPNDEPMFSRFPQSCGVANLGRFLDRLVSFPSFITDAPCGRGFAEGIDHFLRVREGPRPRSSTGSVT